MGWMRPFALVRTGDQWLRCDHDRTFLDEEDGVVSLAWRDPPPSAAQPVAARPVGGLAFDGACRLYRSLPDQGRVERYLWAAGDPLEPSLPKVGPPRPLIEPAAAPPQPAVFSPVAPAGELREPRALAVDGEARLYVADTAGRRLLVYDLWSERLIQRIALAARPLDVAADPGGEGVWLLVDRPPQLLRVESRREPVPLRGTRPKDLMVPRRLAVAPDGTIYLLVGDPGEEQVVLGPGVVAPSLDVPGATDLEVGADGELVVTGRAGEDFRRYRLVRGAWERLQSLRTRGYDGSGVALAPDGRIGYFTARGFRHAIPVRPVYEAEGTVTTFRLDAKTFQTTWGRIFLDACVPPGAELRLRCITSDEPPDSAGVAVRPPGNLPGPDRPELSPPPLPPQLDVGPIDRPLHRRDGGRELPWTPDDVDGFATYEAPIAAPPGRFLWVTLELAGNTRVTPRVKCLRAEHPSHDLMRRLPKLYSRDARAADFLRRYLAPLEGTLGELEARAGERRSLLDPHSVPEEMIAWLADFVGLTVDERVPVARRRRLVAEAVELFRLRGTRHGIERFLEIVLFDDPGGRPAPAEPRRVHVLEHFRLRGYGGPIVGDAGGDFSSRSVLGAGYRVGGAIGSDETTYGAGGEGDPFTGRAHRFTVVLAAKLDAEQRGLVEDILRVHRPAHTMASFCTVDAGMRAGRGLLVGLTSILGRTGGFTTAQVGRAALGRGAIVGRPLPGTRLSGGRLGGDTRVG